MKNSLFLLVLFAVQTIQAQVNVYECDPAYVTTSELEVNNAAYHLHKPCILMDFEAYEIINNYPKYVTASEFIHIKGDYGSGRYFHAGPYTGNDHFWLRIQDQESPYEVWALNYDDVNAIQRYKKLELGIKLQGELLDRINDFLHSTNPQADAINPFLEWELDVNVKFVHAQSLTEKWRDGFFYEDYNVVANDWIKKPVNDFPLRVRFAPPLNGLWNAYVSITYDNQTVELPMFSFNVVESGHPGYVKVHNNKRNLQRGSNIIMPIGHVFPGPYNRAQPTPSLGHKIPWGDVIPSSKNANPMDWEAYIGDIASYINQGGKYFKMVQTSYGNLIEFEELGNYYNRLHYAWEQDKILDLCEENDVLVNFNLLFQDVIMAYGQNGGANPLVTPWCTGYSQDPWDYGRYGPDGDTNQCDYFPVYCYSQVDSLPSSMFLNEDQMKFHKQRTRYYVSRYGYSPQIYTWELMSEPLAMDQFVHGTTTALNGEVIPNTPAQFFYHPGFLTAIAAVDKYHNSISNFIHNNLKDEDHLITIDAAPLQDGMDDPLLHNLTCLQNPNINIIGFNIYSDRPDKWIEEKEGNNNGKENIEFGNPNNPEVSIYKSVHYLNEIYHKPIILSEQGQDWEENCKGETGNIIDMMTGGFSGVAAMHPWSGYSYGGADELYDDRLNWASTIAAEQHMNSTKVIPTLDHWNGYWVQGRQEQKVRNNNDNDGQPKELQYYIAESKESVTGYVRNRSYNVWTNRLSDGCESLENTDGFKFPLSSFYNFEWETGPYNLFVYPLEKRTYYTIRWYDFLTGTEFFNQTYRSKGDGRFRLEYPTLTTESRPILWFSMEKASGNRFVEEEQENEFGSDDMPTTIYPNPFEDAFTIVSKEEDEIEIINSLGSRIGLFKVNRGKTRIDLNACSSGIYFVHSMLTAEVFKIVKQ